MKAVSLDLAQRTSMSAGPVAVHLAADCRAIAEAVRAGDFQGGLSKLETTSDRLARFLTFVVVSADLLRTLAPQVGGFLAEYGRRVLGTLDQLQQALDGGDPRQLCVVLERGLGTALGDYEGYASHVSAALGCRAAA